MEAANDQITLFMRRSHQRVVIADYLNIRAGSHGLFKSMAEVCDHLTNENGGAPIIIVTKKESYNGDDHAAITMVRPHVLIIVCGAEPHCKMHQDDYLAESDDHMIAMLVLSITTVGCSPKIISYDRFRNSKQVFDNIPAYEYTSYLDGECSATIVESGRAWVDDHIIKLALRVPVCSALAVVSFCMLCGATDVIACVCCCVCCKCRGRLSATAVTKIESVMTVVAHICDE